MPGNTAASRQHKKTEKLRRDLEKLMLGADTNIMRKPTMTKSQRLSIVNRQKNKDARNIILD